MFSRRSIVAWTCALALLGCWRPTWTARALADDALSTGTAAWYADRLTPSGGPYEHTTAMPANGYAGIVLGTWKEASISAHPDQPVQAAPYEEGWIGPPAGQRHWIEPDVYAEGPHWDVAPPAAHYPFSSNTWHWQILPDGLIYRSYQAGVHEPRLSLVAFHEESGGRALWDGTLGGRVGLLRYGTVGGLYPQGWQLDVEAAAIVRLTLDEIRDFESADFRVGIPLTYGAGNWQYKLAFYHLSSHLGDEFAISHPGSLLERINYVRDAVVLGASYFPHPAWRLYSEAAYAFNVDGGAEPWEFQFGSELSPPGPTGLQAVPFLALNGHLRQEHNFGGDFTVQAGWLWRGHSGQVTRMGAHYFNGKSSQYQRFDEFEQQIGFGVWYDY